MSSDVRIEPLPGASSVPNGRDVPAAEEPRYDPFASWYHDWVAAPDADPVARSLLGLIDTVTGRRTSVVDDALATVVDMQ
ncbi:MAG TPA: hypothetical protein VFI47_07105 [Acidimicrobiales bacterium]|nr:hypothetical protein [Acidimicrobiales bacterium]